MSPRAPYKSAALLAAVALSACASNESDILVGVYSALPFNSDAQVRGVCITVESRGLTPQRVVAPVSAGVPPRWLFDFRIVPRDDDLSQPVTVTVVGRTRAGCTMGVEVSRRSRVLRFIPGESVRETFVLDGGNDPPPPDGGVVPDAPPPPDATGTCQCPTGLTCCGSACANTRYDPRNCGACGVVCGDTTFCVNGVCSCPTGQQLCDGRRCTDPRTDPEWCGASGCGRPCAPVENGARGCQSGQCVYTCNDNYVPIGGRCAHCGLVNEPLCNRPAPCAAGLTPCNETCRNLVLDRNHCGACNAQCAPSQSCAASSCR